MKLFYIILLVLVPFLSLSQELEISGNVSGSDDLGGIHIINKTSNNYAVTTVTGDFKIKAKLNDTVVLSSILYKIKEVVITSAIHKSKYVSIALEAFINNLDEVTLGRILTGNLSMDVANQGNKKQITFADVGIPGYTGKPLSQSERRLSASTGPFLLGSLINAITGRTKMLKARVDLEKRIALLEKIKSQFYDSFFETHELPEDKRKEFFLFCMDQPDFILETKSLDLYTVSHLEKYYTLYLQQIKK